MKPHTPPPGVIPPTQSNKIPQVYSRVQREVAVQTYWPLSLNLALLNSHSQTHNRLFPLMLIILHARNSFMHHTQNHAMVWMIVGGIMKLISQMRKCDTRSSVMCPCSEQEPEPGTGLPPLCSWAVALGACVGLRKGGALHTGSSPGRL